MLRTLLFVLVLGITVSASAGSRYLSVNLTHVNEGLPRSIQPNSILSNDAFFNQNIIPITGYYIETRHLEFTFKYKSCGTFIKNNAFKTEYLRLAQSIIFVKLKLNPEYRNSTIQQASCTSERSELSINPRKITIDLHNELYKLYPELDLPSTQVIIVNDYLDPKNILDLSSADAINKFIDQ